MAKITWTREAETWLEDIFDYISADSPVAAQRVVESIYLRTQDLSDFPYLGYRYTALSDREVRVLLFGHYRIAYLIKPSGDIDILGVFHGALDLERYLV